MPTPIPSRSRATTRQKWLLALTSAVAAIGIIAVTELLLAAFGVGDRDLDTDPFFDFEAVTGLFERVDTQRGPAFRTRESKLAFFNLQEFPATKSPRSYRVFALGGSTTFGRPYDWRVAFPNWLEHLLRASGTGRDIEVINAGGVWYASYRIRALMDELLDYEPDLFVVYTGQNEFLEERVYGDRLRENAVLKIARRELSGLRTVKWLRGLIGADPDQAGKQQLATEVRTRLDVWEGLSSFTRDDALRDEVLAHFEWNIKSMVQLARAHDIPIVFVSPASNTRDFSPFKSEHREGLALEQKETFDAALRTGRDALAKGRADQALAAFDRAVEIDAAHADAHFQRGVALRAAGRHAEADAAFESALALDVCPLRAVPAIGNTLRQITAEMDVPLVDLPAALIPRSKAASSCATPGNEDFLDHVHPDVEVHQLIAESVARVLADQEWLPQPRTLTAPDRARIYASVIDALDPVYYARRDLNLAKVLGWSGKYAEAAEALQRARPLLQGDVELHYNLGILFRRRGQPADALAEYQKALATNPQHYMSRFSSGVALQAMDRHAEACDAFRRAAELEPDSAECWHKLATSCWRNGDFGGAQKALDEVARLDESYPGLALLRGRVLLDDDDNELATAALEVSAERHPQWPQPRYYLGIARIRLGDLNGAERAMNEALALQPDFVPALRGLAQIHETAERPDEAVASYERALLHAPDDATLHFELGSLHHKCKRPGQAARCYIATIEKDPEHTKALTNLGTIFAQQRDFRRATTAFTRAIELDPDDGNAHYNLAQLKLATGDIGGARHHVEKAQALGIEPPAAFLSALGK